MKKNNSIKNIKIDPELINKIIETNNSELFAIIITKYNTALTNFINKKTKDSDLTKDVVNVAFTKAFFKLNQYNYTSAFSTWLFSIANHTYIDMLRKNKATNNTISLDTYLNTYDDPHSIDIIDPDLLADDKLIKQQLHESLNNTIETIEDKYKIALKLRYFDELSYEEISKKLNIPYGTAKVNVFRAKQILKNLIEANPLTYF